MKARYGSYVSRFASISYPYGKLAFLRARPLTREEKIARMNARVDAMLEAEDARKSREDSVVMWVSLAILVILYAALDASLILWLAGDI